MTVQNRTTQAKHRKNVKHQYCTRRLTTQMQLKRNSFGTLALLFPESTNILNVSQYPNQKETDVNQTTSGH